MGGFHITRQRLIYHLLHDVGRGIAYEPIDLVDAAKLSAPIWRLVFAAKPHRYSPINKPLAGLVEPFAPPSNSLCHPPTKPPDCG